jgi:hypothetical protein
MKDVLRSSLDVLMMSANEIECEVQRETLLKKLTEYELEHNGMEYDDELVETILLNASARNVSIQMIVQDLCDGEELIEKSLMQGMLDAVKE